jgi:hypothetical protein
VNKHVRVPEVGYSKNGSYLLTRTGVNPTIIDDKVADLVFSNNPNNWQP